MKSLAKLKRILIKERAEHGDFDIRIPSLWEPGKKAYSPYFIRPSYSYFIERLEAVLARAEVGMDNSQPYYKTHEGGNNGTWIKDSLVYSMLPRYSSALYPEDEAGYEGRNFSFRGSFLKSILLLDMLKYMGIDTIYLLPIMMRSSKDRKGEAGSCYSIKYFTDLDDGLKDELSGARSSVELEFSAFMEAAHSYGMKVLMDIIPRTLARDNLYILALPESFYWIKKEDLGRYKSPRVPLQQKMEAANEKNLKRIFQSEEVREHLKLFQPDPKAQDPALFTELQQKVLKDQKLSILDLIEESYGLTVAPAFSDCINDTQPPWSDITYLRLYLDHPALSQKYLNKLGLHPAPYILFDVAKASNVPGTKVNRPLWDLLVEIIPYYQRLYGIDGVRIDMGHALPKELLTEIMEAARASDESFCFIAEELDTKRASLSKQAGYHTIVGDAFIKLNELEDGGYINYIKSVKTKPLPIFSSAETHDTARLASKEGGEKRARAITAASLFIPNSVGFINTMQEIFEVQPMNLGIGLGEEDRYILNKSDYNYGRLALFDYAVPSWDRAYSSNMLEDLRLLSLYRKKYLGSAKSEVIYMDEDKTAISLFHRPKSLLLVACNTDYDKALDVKLDLDALKKGLKALKQCDIIYSSLGEDKKLLSSNSSINFELKAMECLILELRY